MTGEKITGCGLVDGQIIHGARVHIDEIPAGQEGDAVECVKVVSDENSASAICANCSICKKRVSIGRPYTPPEYPTPRK